MWRGSETIRNAVLVSIILADIVLFAITPYETDLTALLGVAGVVSVMYFVGWFYRTVRPEPKFAAAAIGSAQFIVFTGSMGLLNHLLTYFTGPLIDDMLIGWDHSLGFYWPDFVMWAQSIGWLDTLSTIAYQSSLLLVALVVLVMSFSGALGQLERYLNAFFICGIATVLFWAVFPSFGAMAYYTRQENFPEITGVINNRAYVEEFFRLKEGEWTMLLLSNLKGLIAFPSFHTVMAVLTVYAVWGMRWIFWPVLLWNCLVLFSVPVDGGHHLVDLIAGLALSFVAIFAVERRSRTVSHDAPKEAFAIN